MAHAIVFTVSVGDKVKYSDVQFGNLDGSELYEILITRSGTYAKLKLKNELFTVPYFKIKQLIEE